MTPMRGGEVLKPMMALRQQASWGDESQRLLFKIDEASRSAFAENWIWQSMNDSGAAQSQCWYYVESSMLDDQSHAPRVPRDAALIQRPARTELEWQRMGMRTKNHKAESEASAVEGWERGV